MRLMNLLLPLTTLVYFAICYNNIRDNKRL